jgi:hypothetical protein
MTSGSPGPAEARLTREASVAAHKVIGAKHVRDGRPCQDDIAVARAGGSWAIAVADGHGSSVHAEIGARIAVEVASEHLLAFAASMGPEHRVDPRAVHGFAQDPFRRLLVREWTRRVREHAGADDVALKDYGSTLLFALATPEFLLLGQLGDGDILVVDATGAVTRPLPTDPRCFGEDTPSLCLPDAPTSLRVVTMPVPAGETLLLVSTDGYGKSYATDVDFERIGPDYLEMVREIGASGVGENLEAFLTAVTTGGSGDDIALGLVYLPPVRPAGETGDVTAVSEPATATEPSAGQEPALMPAPTGPPESNTMAGPATAEICPLIKANSKPRTRRKRPAGDST